jgi:hypothetical protein
MREEVNPVNYVLNHKQYRQHYKICTGTVPDYFMAHSHVEIMQQKPKKILLIMTKHFPWCANLPRKIL